MAVVNRFTQTQQPLVFNPISAEQFAMVPLAKAQAKAAGIRAANTLDIDYNVDPKDQKVVANMVNNVDEGKDDIINRIMSEGISENTFTDFMELKKVYKTTKDKVNAAEQNKASVDKWKDQVLRLHQNDPKYIEYIYGKEYGQGWQGTFREDGTTDAFEGQFGPRSFSIVDDARKALQSIPMTMVKDLQGGGTFKMEKDPNGNEHLVYVTSSNRKTYSNEDKVVERMNAYLNEYSNPSTERGAYKTYREIDDKFIADTFEAVAKSMVQTDTRGGDTRKQVISRPTDEETGNTISPSAPLRTNVPQVMNKVSEGKELDYNPIVRHNLRMSQPLLAHVATVVDAIANPGMFLKDVILGPGIIDRYEGKLAKIEQAQEEYKYDAGEVEALQASTAKLFMDKVNYNKETSDYLKTKVKGYDMNLGQQETKLYEDIAKFKFDLEKGKYSNEEEAYAEFYLDKIYPYLEDNVATTKAEFSVLTSESLLNKKLGLKNDVVGEMKDIYSEIIANDALTRPYMNLNTRDVNGKEAFNMIKSAMGNAGRVATSYEDGEYRATKFGTGGAHPDTYKGKNADTPGGYVEDLAFGNIYTIEESKGDGTFKTVGTYIIGPAEYVKNSSDYAPLQNNLRAMANIGIEEGKGMAFYTTNEAGERVAVQGQIGRSGLSTNASTHGVYKTAGPGSLTFIIPATGTTYQYTQDMLDDMTINE